MTLADLERLLAELDPALSGLSEPWCVIGSAAMMIAGAPVADCPDLDIMTTAAGAATLETAWDAWRDRAYAPTSGEVFRSRFSGYAFREGRVEVMGDLLLMQAGRWTPVAIPAVVATCLAGITVNTPDRQAQIDLFRLFGRPKDLAKAALLAG
ncbi:MAG: hypothetical protein Q7J28_11565 [Caulobacter sp.]|nr:hypothetical protein [Caulobacter sp.]